jgi:hypothetical protein
MLQFTSNFDPGSTSSFGPSGSFAPQVAHAPAVEYAATLWLMEPQAGQR